MEKIKIIEGDARTFELEVEKALKEGYKPARETHRCIEYVGKLFYSCLFVKMEEEE